MMRIHTYSLVKLARNLDMPQAIYTKDSAVAEIRNEQFFYVEISRISMVVRDILKRRDFQFSAGRYGGIPCFEKGKYSMKLVNQPGRVLAQFLSCIRECKLSLEFLPEYLKCDPFVYYFIRLCREYDCVLYVPWPGPVASVALVCEEVNNLLAELRTLCSNECVITLRKNIQRLSNSNADSTFAFLRDTCCGSGSIRIARLNLYPSLDRARLFDPKTGVVVFKKFLKKNIEPIKKNLAYLWHLEYAVSGDVYFHLVLIMQPQAEQNWEQEAKAIGDLWLGESQADVRGFALCKDRITTCHVKKEGAIKKEQIVRPTFQSAGTGDHLTLGERFQLKLKAIAISLTQQERAFHFIDPVRQDDDVQRLKGGLVAKNTNKRSYVVLGRKKLT